MCRIFRLGEAKFLLHFVCSYKQKIFKRSVYEIHNRVNLNTRLQGKVS